MLVSSDIDILPFDIITATNVDANNHLHHRRKTSNSINNNNNNMMINQRHVTYSKRKQIRQTARCQINDEIQICKEADIIKLPNVKYLWNNNCNNNHDEDEISHRLSSSEHWINNTKTGDQFCKNQSYNHIIQITSTIVNERLQSSFMSPSDQVRWSTSMCHQDNQNQNQNTETKPIRFLINKSNIKLQPSQVSLKKDTNSKLLFYRSKTSTLSSLLLLIISIFLSIMITNLSIAPTSHFLAHGYQLTNNLIASNLPPKFISTNSQQMGGSNSEIVVRVKEGPGSIGKLIYTLRGEDPDDDPITFGVLGSMASDLLRIENVPKNQANVYLKKELDRETTESYQVVITLTDGKLGRGNWITKSMLIIVSRQKKS